MAWPERSILLTFWHPLVSCFLSSSSPLGSCSGHSSRAEARKLFLQPQTCVTHNLLPLPKAMVMYTCGSKEPLHQSEPKSDEFSTVHDTNACFIKL